MHKLSIYSEQNDLIFGLGKNKSRKHFDEILSSTLFKRRNELCQVLDEHAPGWSRVVFKDNLYIEIKLHKTDYSAIVVAACIKDDAFKVINTDVARNAIVECINTAFKHVCTLFNIDKCAQDYGGRINDVFLLSLFQYEIDNVSSSLESQYGYNLIDLVLSFANLHYMKPDLFYPDELKLFIKEITDATK